MNEEAVYNGLMKRREQQKAELDQDNPNFGCWDKDVTTALEDGKYVEVSKEKALENIGGHLSRATGLYNKYQSCRYDAMELRRNEGLKRELIDLIRSKLA
jgi:hypothetical protein